MAARPQVLVLNGTSSAGKSTLATALQDRWPALLLDAGLDRHLSMLPRRHIGTDWPQVYDYRSSSAGVVTEVRLGQVGRRLYRAMHRAAAAVAGGGTDVVLDHVLLDRESAVDLARSLTGVDAALIGVRCEEPTLSRREAARSDRTLGQAAAQLDAVHAHGSYDFVVDTGLLDQEEAADAVMQWVAGGPTLTALERMRG